MIDAPPKDLVLNPFAYVSDMGSRIAGLGGQGRPAEGDYVFHTPYVEVAEGSANFTVRFVGLEATRGTLNLRVHMLTDASPHAKLATAERIAFNRLILNGGIYSVRFEAFQNATYALYAGVSGQTDARAQSADVVLDRPFDQSARRETATEARNTDFGGNARPQPHLISLRAASLKAPTCQFATARQLRDVEAGLGGDKLEYWRSAYLLQALHCYGLLEPGARGVGLGWETLRMAAKLAGRGPSIDVVIPPAESRTVGAPNHASDLHAVTIRENGLTPISADIVNYDFLWTDGIAGRQGTLIEGVRWIEATMAFLRPGGFAVHVVDYDPAGRTGGFQRNDIERIMLQLISRGHEVAELRIDSARLLTNDRGLSACGIVARKGSLRLEN